MAEALSIEKKDSTLPPPSPSSSPPPSPSHSSSSPRGDGSLPQNPYIRNQKRKIVEYAAAAPPSPSYLSGSPFDDGSLPQNPYIKKWKRQFLEYEADAANYLNFSDTKILKKSDRKTFNFVKNLFMSGMAKVDPKAVVIDVHSVQLSASPFSRSKWDEFDELIEKTKAERDGEANVVYAWYAASKEKVVAIFSNGFEVPKNDRHLSRKLQNGAFLAHMDSPHLSATQFPVLEKEGEKYLILCRVVLGNVEKVDLEFNQKGPCRNEYDTGCDNPTNPNWYVVWNGDINKRILPECVLTCKSSAIVPVEWNIFGIERYSMFPLMVIGVKHLIPFRDVHLVDAMYDEYKSGKVSKEAFLNSMEAMFGNDVMLKAIDVVLRLP